MGKVSIKLTLRDLYAIKHALQNTLEIKYKRLEVLKEYNCPHDFKELTELQKDIEHEEALLKRLETNIDAFKEYIGG